MNLRLMCDLNEKSSNNLQFINEVSNVTTFLSQSKSQIKYLRITKHHKMHYSNVMESIKSNTIIFTSLYAI